MKRVENTKAPGKEPESIASGKEAGKRQPDTILHVVGIGGHGRIALARRFRSCAVATLLILSLSRAGNSVAGEGPDTQPAPAMQPAPAAIPAEQAAPDPAEIDLKGKRTPLNKMDTVHEGIKLGILNQVVRLDNFFGNPASEEEGKTGYQLRMRNSIRVDQEGKVKPGVLVRANVTLSRISDRLRLFIEGENEPKPIDQSLPEDPGNPGFDRPGQTTKIVNTELRYGFFQTPATDIFLAAGFRLVWPPEAFVRSRFQHVYHISDVTQARFAETLFVNSLQGVGATTEVGMERLLNPKTVLRWASTGTVSSKIHGFEWGTELSLVCELSSKSAITLMGGVYGNTTFDDVVRDYRLLARYRRNFLRSWLFYELHPEVSWLRNADGKLPPNYAITFLLEFAFHGSTTDTEKKTANP
jgi:hypothetical protein